MAVAVRADVSSRIGLASHQNARPVLNELEIVGDDEVHADLVVTLTADPSFLKPRSWTIDRIRPGGSVRLADRDVSLAAGFLADLNETVTGTVMLRVSHADRTLAVSEHPVTLLKPSEWGGAASMGELLAAFVTPTDPAVDGILLETSGILRRAGKPDGFDGYADRSRSRAWDVTSAIWSAICGLRLVGERSPAGFATEGQAVRSPTDILKDGRATDLDLALLFAAVVEQAGLNPLVVLTGEQALAGAWLQPQEFAALVTDEAASLRKRADLQDLVLLETALTGQAHPPGFGSALAGARRRIAEDADSTFTIALDIRRARLRRIHPLDTPRHSPPNNPSDDSAVRVGTLASFEAAPPLPAFDVEVTAEPSTPAGRIALWQRRLLDLTTRNRLLNLPEGAKAVRLACPEPARLEDRLSAGKRIRVVAEPDFGNGGPGKTSGPLPDGEDQRAAYARAALERDQVVAVGDAKHRDVKHLDQMLIDLYRKARSDLEEGGANTLYLALGFLKWRRSGADTRVYQAPLILLPVKLERMSALSGVALLRHDDEARFNLTLLEMLRQDFALPIPGLDGSLPMDASGVDVAGIWNLVRRAVRDVPGFEVTEDVVISTFSFAKYLMWKDLADRSDQLAASPVVRHLIERARERFPEGPPFPRPEHLDDAIDPSALFVPLPADSSQIAAVVASARGCNFVLDGPPGTGKSQTIANMIAHNLALGRRILFVAEKRAALDVVHRRLAEKGLGTFCLELHSNRASKLEVLKSLERAWETRDALSPEEWAREAAQVRRLRDRLNAVVRLLHERHGNGLTLHGAIGRVVRDWSPELPDLGWTEDVAHDKASLDALRETVHRLDLHHSAIPVIPDAFAPIRHQAWSNGWQARTLAAARAIAPARSALDEARDGILAATRLRYPATDLDTIAKLHRLATALLAASGQDLRFAFAPDATARIARVRNVADAIDGFRAAETSLSTSYSADGLRRLDLDRLDAAWAEAARSVWPFNVLARRRVTARLRREGHAIARPDPARDLPVLRRMAGFQSFVASAAPDLAGPPGCDAGHDTVAMRRTAEIAEALRSALSAAAADADTLTALARVTATLVIEANDLLSPDGRIAGAAADLGLRLAAWEDTAGHLAVLLALGPSASRDLDGISALGAAIATAPAGLKPWCDWQRVRQTALDAGLRAVVLALEAGTVAEGGALALFETIHARWFAARGIDAEPDLRDLVTAEHGDAIDAFRRLDERLDALAIRMIRARICGLIPDKDTVGRKGGYGVLKHELRKQRAHKPIRQLAAEMGEAFTRLAPCMLMSPLSIAQYLPPDQALFDLVIFDEASQITPWDAIGSIARGRQVVVAGDPRQMPPTSFFTRSANADEADEVEADMVSILDECLAAGVPSHGLSWHYRSRHESLIAFSNHRYYDGALITFPAAETRASAVEWRRVSGVYAKGKGRTNQIEAQAIVAEIVRRLTDPDCVDHAHTLAVITLNTEQQALIENLLDLERRRRPEIEYAFGEDVPEPVVVKNLETVQGDERDVILLGIGYGPTEAEAGTMSMNFGPLNRDGGWRRLNVALTRARREMVVFTSFEPGMIDLNRTSAPAVRDLKHFLEFAERGPRALAEAVQGSLGGAESPFEEAVAAALSGRGWVVVPQIGVSRFRIDLGVVHPDRPGDYLAGVECDGATYHAAATARDRDRVRATILEGLGWSLVRVWSTDWWVDRAGALDRLDTALRSRLAESRLQLTAAGGAFDPPADPESPDGETSLR
ncbi:DUF4011 domain-containing protein [Methylobacterium sp. 37f]|uniref:DUF4011 domain-containing protein n=1 Tax=Methylobacterium sp. 37f TaxID=2817058 RepID=UPI001FFDA174|nr:DUF4011 domain-containing protein [Methylobacterium sp. 37f]MCK2056454.1 DUF4011 domain-containing protein [Methylobacterium sp. 37f]